MQKKNQKKNVKKSIAKKKTVVEKKVGWEVMCVKYKDPGESKVGARGIRELCAAPIPRRTSAKKVVGVFFLNLLRKRFVH